MIRDRWLVANRRQSRPKGVSRSTNAEMCHLVNAEMRPQVSQVHKLLWPKGSNGPMIRLMNRLLRHLAAGGFLATTAMTSLIACVQGPPPQGALAPATRPDAPPAARVDATQMNRPPMLA